MMELLLYLGSHLRQLLQLDHLVACSMFNLLEVETGSILDVIPQIIDVVNTEKFLGIMGSSEWRGSSPPT